MRRLLLAGLLALAACSTSAPPTAAPPRPVAVAPPPAPAAPAPPADTCGAAQHRSLIGRPRTEIPVPVRPNLQRVMCTTCPMTMDFNPERLDFLFDATTGLIKEVRCG